MASLRDMVSEYQDDLRNGIAWLAFWREGRSWQAEAFHLDLDDTLYPEDRARLAEIQAADPRAVVVNGYYSGYLGEEMNVAELAAGVRHHYDNGLNNIAPFMEAHSDELPPDVLEEAREKAHAAGLPFYERPYLTVSDTATGDGDFSLTLNVDELSALLEQFGGSVGGSAALTPDGNLSLIDDIGTTGGKQFITLQTKAGNTFYLIIDRDDEGEETVHFLNQVDEADLMALTEDGETAPATCTCTEKCEAGAVNTACPVCKNNLTACVGAATENEEPAEATEPEEEAGNSMGGLIVFLVVLLIGGGAALYFFKFKKPKADVKGSDDLDEYDFGEDEDDEDEPAPEVDDDTGEVEARPLDDYLLDEEEPKKEDEE